MDLVGKLFRCACAVPMSQNIQSTPEMQPQCDCPHTNCLMHTVSRSSSSSRRCFIEPPQSDWVAPMVLVKIKRTPRVCTNYRCLNALSRVDAYPMPCVEDLVDQLDGAKHISTLDLTQRYWQVPVAQHATTPSHIMLFNAESAESMKIHKNSQHPHTHTHLGMRMGFGRPGCTVESLCH